MENGKFDMPENHSTLNNLVTLSSPLVYFEDAEKMTRRLPNLQKLKCIFLESGLDLENHHCFPRLDLLTRLESLTLSYHGRSINSGEFCFPSNLTKLSLSNFCLPWSHISAIGRLENLEVLKLLPRAFEGEKWDMFEGEFLKLKFLKLESLNIIKWNATSDDIPRLERLVLRNCKLLEEVPYLGDIPTLQMIELHNCSDSCEESVRNIAEDAEALKVHISH